MSEPIVPQADPLAGYRAAKGDIDAAVARVLAGGRYILGDEVVAFEAEFATYLGVPDAVGASSGTDAIALALRALGIGPGDGVVTVAHTAVATVAAVEMIGATPVLVDIDPLTYTLDPQDLTAVLRAPPVPIKAILPVHLYGHPADMTAIMALAEAYGLAVVEDASQAHGAALGGRRVGSFGVLSAFSLYPTKNLGALGDAGVIAVNDGRLAEPLRALRQYGWRRRDDSTAVGVNARLDELQAAILRVKLARLEADNDARRAIAAAYDAALADLPLIRPHVAEGVIHARHQYVVRTPRRDALRARLVEQGVGSAVHYPIPVHLQSAYAGRLPLGPSGLAVSEQVAGEILSLPIFPQMTGEQVQRVIAAVRAA
ncbi:MAG: erythromycin biosynthesis sensory transduction protein eryC1 [Caulobacterales bacterium 68-7]|mgnify:CR=1 FL=1|nr:MAG: erythromycin biosynthesis sensory transduction protein eryC1 [Caulobacterales bacterium 68-7]